MATNKRRVAGAIFSMILTTNVLCTELFHAPTTISLAKQMHKLKTAIPYQSSLHGKSDGECARGEDYCFVKKTGHVLNTDADMTAFIHINKSLTVEHCMDTCKRYFCIAFLVFNFSYSLIHPPLACIFFDTMPEVTISDLLSFDIYIRTSRVPLPATSPTPAPAEKVFKPAGQPKKKREKHWGIWLLGAFPPVIAICFLAVTYYYSKRKTTRNSRGTHELQEEELGKRNSPIWLGTRSTTSCIPTGTHKLKEPKKLGNELQIFRFKSLCTATNQFSDANKLGEGGFGPVYKASLLDGQEVAVKRLSRSSSQGLGEFRNEIKLIAKLQHKNLVRLLGCCLEGNEKMLVYEFSPNKSLDFFLFDHTKKKQLDWKKRLDIIEGTIQGLLYLHKHSRLKVIHRDLKTSNVLLDRDLKPKISDFGIARIFEQNASEASTNRVVGTYGYMSPEYAMAGLYSEKSDVFSFGVIVLEIMSGKKATSFSGVEDPLNLIRYAWDLWKEDQSSELIDQGVSEIYDTEELLRHIHVGLLCVEECVADRPTMSDVLLMLTNIKMPLPAPKQPAFYCGNRKTNIVVQHENEAKTCSPNLVTLSPVEGR